MRLIKDSVVLIVTTVIANGLWIVLVHLALISFLLIVPFWLNIAFRLFILSLVSWA